MGAKSKIEWTDATWSPVTGCTRVSPGCERCYAERMAKRFGLSWEVTLHPGRLADPFKWKKRRRIFVCSQGDLFHEDVPLDFVGKVLSVMAANPRHTFLLLTKRPKRMAFWSPGFGENVWLGVSIEDQRTADDRIPILLQILAAFRFVSCEPLLERVSLRRYLWDWEHRLDWVIAGGESGYGAKPCEPNWFRLLRSQCGVYGVPFFLKQLGGFPNKRGGDLALLDGKPWREMPPALSD